MQHEKKNNSIASTSKFEILFLFFLAIALLVTTISFFGRSSASATSSSIDDVLFDSPIIKVGTKFSINGDHTVTVCDDGKVVADETNGKEVGATQVASELSSFKLNKYATDPFSSLLGQSSLISKFYASKISTNLSKVDKNYWTGDYLNWHGIQLQGYKKSDNTDEDKTYSIQGKAPDGTLYNNLIGSKINLSGHDFSQYTHLEDYIWPKDTYIWSLDGVTQEGFNDYRTSLKLTMPKDLEVYNNPFLIHDPSVGYYKTTLRGYFEDADITGKVVIEGGCVFIRPYSKDDTFNAGDTVFYGIPRGLNNYTGFKQAADGYWSIYFKIPESGKIKKKSGTASKIVGIYKSMGTDVSVTGSSFSEGKHAIRPMFAYDDSKIVFMRNVESGKNLTTSAKLGDMPENAVFAGDTSKAVIYSDSTKLDCEINDANVSTNKDAGRASKITQIVNGVIKVPYGTKELTIKNINSQNADYISALAQTSTEKKYGILSKADTGSVKIDLTSILDTTSTGSKATVSLYAEKANGTGCSDLISKEPVTFEVEVILGSTQTLRYDKNGGTGVTPDNVVKKSGETIQIADGAKFSKEGNVFTRWEISYIPFGESEEVSYRCHSGELIIMPDSANSLVTVKAIYTSMEITKSTTTGDTVFTVTWDANAPDGCDTRIDGEKKVNKKVAKIGGIAKLSSSNIPSDAINNTTSKTYFFAGWSTNKNDTADNAKSKASLTGVVISSNVTYYAIWRSTYTITWDANGGYFGSSTSTVNIKKTITPGNTVSTSQMPTENPKIKDDTLWFVGYNTQADGKGDTVSSESSTKPTSDVTYYAQWCGSYWFAEAGAENPESKVYKITKQIKEDVKAINEEPEGTVAEEYNKMLEEDKYHLYTKLSGKDGKEKNDYVEFRIIEVGKHDISGWATQYDDAALTFMSTHSLPKAYAMNNGGYNECYSSDGWVKTDLRKQMNETDGSIYKLFDKTFTSSILKVKKSYVSGPYTGPTVSQCEDTLWIPSNREIYNYNSEAAAWEVNMQYKYFANKSVSITKCTSLKGIDNTRDGTAPEGQTRTGSGDDGYYAWTRTPSRYDNLKWNVIKTTGVARTWQQGYLSQLNSVIVGFCF